MVSTAGTPLPGSDRPRPDGQRSRRRSSAPLAKIGMVLFAIGLVAIIADLILFATGSADLPLWLNMLCLLAPLGFGLGLLGVVRETRRASPALVARAQAAVAAKTKRTRKP